MTTKLLKYAVTPLERHVARWIDARASEYNDGATSVLDDIAHGCSSGIVNHLIYTVDCVRFYRRFRKDIDAIVYEYNSELGFRPQDMNGWDIEDPFAREDQNQNVLAWFGFEEAARTLGDRAFCA